MSNVDCADKTYYKVVCKDRNEELISYIAGGKLSVIYKIGEWVRPNFHNTKLMVFESLDDAKRFAASDDPDKKLIYECQIVNGTKSIPKTFLNYSYVLKPWLNEKIAVAFLKKMQKKRYLHLLADGREYVRVPPSGTIFCDSVKLTKLVSSIIYWGINK